MEVNTLDNKLREAFSQYFETATSNLRGTGQLHGSSTPLETNGAELRQLVAELERGGLFDNDQRKSIKKAFQDLYEFRSNLVHGNAKLLKQQVYVGHLREAREFARKCLLWFLHCLDHILTEVGKRGSTGVLPSRESILSVLDLDDGAKSVIELLPTGFPSVSTWRTL